MKDTDDGRILLDNLYDTMSGLSNLARAFSVTGNTKLSKELFGYVTAIQESIELHQKITGELTSSLLSAHWAGTINMFKGVMAGVAVGSKDPEMIATAETFIGKD